jgi:hypothetical protein
LWALYGGVAAYLLAHVAFRLRNIGSLNRQRVVLAVGLLALTPVVEQLSAAIQLGVLAGLVLVLVGYETVGPRQWREQIRAGLH